MLRFCNVGNKGSVGAELEEPAEADLTGFSNQLFDE